ncbi:zinc ribbon domain-containing protein [Streptomyces sp. RKAG293]|uniref:NADase-type glycan-binding domain-containing protein n=1 Tax=Streptomyces sp. RKAG293 TaxID=2893403 RepID=UPI0020333D78|nr:zinc ribbon domain-containing protein [Streptomyces sp. RKAG293]MCM2422394.1 zinc ribbon domain-containing protein [Streptomyces sp. RKAG293]
MTSQQASPSTPPSSAAGDAPGDTARHCAECGTRPTPGQSFCDGCGAVLGWIPDREERDAASAADRQRGADTPGASEPEEGTPPDADTDADTDANTDADTGADSDTGPGAVARGTGPVRGPVAVRAGTDAPAVVPDGDDGPPTIPADPVAPAASPAAATPDPDASARARALLVPVADQRAAAPAPDVAPVLPGVPAAARPRVQAPSAEPADETGAPCPWCEVGNRPDRHFCRRCGMSLAERPGVPAARRPWWRRMWEFGNRPAPWAGERPRLRRGIGRVFPWIAYGLALGLVIYAALNVGTAWNATRDHFAKRVQVTPDSAAASHTFAGHPPKALFDKINNSWWGPGVSQSAEGEWVEARFREPTRLLNILITAGISTKASDLTEAALPHALDAVVTTADGKQTTRRITLDQVSGPQQRKFRADNVVSVRFVIRSAFNAGPDKQVSIAEIEFFTRATNSGT